METEKSPRLLKLEKTERAMERWFIIVAVITTLGLIDAVLKVT